jgi:hypothetical protein
MFFLKTCAGAIDSHGDLGLGFDFHFTCDVTPQVSNEHSDREMMVLNTLFCSGEFGTFGGADQGIRKPGSHDLAG